MRERYASEQLKADGNNQHAQQYSSGVSNCLPITQPINI